MNGRPMDKHEDFLLDTLMPIIAAHAAEVGVSMEEAAMASFLCLGTILQHKGRTERDLLAAIKASAMGVHAEPGAMQ